MLSTLTKKSNRSQGRRKKRNRRKVIDKQDGDGEDESNLKQEAKEYQNQESFCQECKATSKDVQYRPLVDENGSYLCDTCYKIKFPATAMYDITENQNVVKGKFQEHDLRKKQRKLAAQEDGLKGTTAGNDSNHLDDFPEEEECSSCLDKGIFRKCCKKYYCHICYYNENKTCPGCGSSIHRSGASIPKSKPTKLAVLASWGLTFSIILILLGVISAFVLHNRHRPETVWQDTCHGWFPSCDKPICLDVDKDSTLMPTTYKFCSFSQTVNKVIGNRCIIDPQLYKESNGTSGFDICLQSDSQHQRSTPSSSKSKKEFESGIYVFEENFDYWKNETDYTSQSIVMKSARWSYMINARATDICGINVIVRPHEVERPPTEEETAYKVPSALVFSGVQNRYAETIPLDVRYGGMVEFFLKFAPLVENELAVECKSSFSGDITLSYSVDDGLNWEIIRTYPVWKYRKVKFSHINETIPLEAQSNHTQFKWEQPAFDSIRDFWAIDDIRIFHKFELSWRQSDWFLSRKSKRWDMDQKEQCCLDTERCLNFPNYKSLEIDCNSDKHRKNANYRVKIVDMFLIAAATLTILKKGCHDFQNWNEDSDAPVEVETVGSLTYSSIAPSERKFSLNTSRSWQIFAFIVLIAPFVSFVVILLLHVLHFDDYYNMSSIQTVFVYVAIGLDFWTIRSLSTNILQFWPFHVQQRIKIDMSKEEFVLKIGEELVPILDISNVESFTEKFYAMLFASVVISGIPLGTICILIKSMGMKYTQYIVFLNAFGLSLIIRSILGPKWFLEIFIAITWIFSPSMIARDEMGRALAKPSVRHVVTNATVVSILLYIVLFVTFEPLRTASFDRKILIFSLVLMIGSISGSTLGMMRGLPITSRIYLTTWPSEGFSFVNDRCKMQPRTWAKLFGGGMNSVQIHILQVQRQQGFKELLSGSDILEKIKEPKEQY